MKIRKVTCPEKATSRFPGIKLQFNCTAIDRHWYRLQQQDNNAFNVYESIHQRMLQR